MVKCNICPHFCEIPDGFKGFCGARENRGGELKSLGAVSSVAVDPIEKKPLYHFHPGRPILSIGGFGCNLRCPFCQNHQIAAPTNLALAQSDMHDVSVEEIVAMAKKIPNNIGVAYTYNEPLINYEFLLNCTSQIRGAGLCNVLVTNGFINPEPLKALLPFIDAVNIDLKGFTDEFYANLNGSLQPVLDTIAIAHKHCHVEVTTLVIPGENESHIEPIAKWLAGLDCSIPYHISRFFPRHQYEDKPPTPPQVIYRLCDVAGNYLSHVYPGNV